MCLLIIGALFILPALYWVLPYLLIALAGFVVIVAVIMISQEVSEKRVARRRDRGDRCLGISAGLGVEKYRATLDEGRVVIHTRFRNCTDETIDLSSAAQVDVQVFSQHGPVSAERWFWTKTEVPPLDTLTTRLRIPIDLEGRATQWAIAHQPGQHLFFPIGE